MICLAFIIEQLLRVLFSKTLQFFNSIFIKLFIAFLSFSRRKNSNTNLFLLQNIPFRSIDFVLNFLIQHKTLVLA